MKLEKALYDCVQSVKIWYNHLNAFMKRIGFTPNNRMTDSNKQLTLTMHVDDWLATCVDRSEVINLDWQISQEFNDQEASEVNSTKFDYQGINIDTSSGVEAELTIKQYI